MAENKETFSKLIKEISSIKCRLNWDEYFMVVSTTVAARSSCKKLNVGCVITKNNRILCTGYNGHIPGAPHDSFEVDGHEQMTIHAEINAVCHAAKDGIKLQDTKAYITHYPCINCAKSLLSSGVNEIIYMNEYKKNPLVSKLFSSKGIKVVQMLV